MVFVDHGFARLGEGQIAGSTFCTRKATVPRTETNCGQTSNLHFAYADNRIPPPVHIVFA